MEINRIQYSTHYFEGVVGLALCWFKSSHPHYHFLSVAYPYSTNGKFERFLFFLIYVNITPVTPFHRYVLK